MMMTTTMWDQTDHPRQDSSRIQVMDVNPFTFDDDMMVQWQMQEMEIIPDDPRRIHSLLEDLPELPEDIVATSMDLFPSLPPDSCTPTINSTTTRLTLITSSGSSSTPNPPNPTIDHSTILVRADDTHVLANDDETPNPSPPISNTVNKPTDHVRSTRKKSCNPSPKAKKSRTGKKAKLVKELASEGEVQAQEIRRVSQADHIIRERQRRDDMAAKYTLLETLLPPAPKRERAMVVEDTMMFVKNLQHRKEELLKKQAQLKLTVLTHAGLAPWTGSRHMTHKPSATTTTHGMLCERGSPLSSSMNLVMRSTGTPGIIETCAPGGGNCVPSLSNITSCKDIKISNTSNSCSSCVKTLHIHAGLPDEEIVIEMVCSRPPSNLHSMLIRTVESVCLELTNFSLHRISHELVECKISGKSWVQHGSPDLQSSPMSKVAALRTILELM